jgi:phosphate transport system substrate-binding protein
MVISLRQIPSMGYSPRQKILILAGINSRGQYVCVQKTKHVDAAKGLQKFLYEFAGEHAIGLDGYLADKGFIPLDDRGRNSARDAVLSLPPIEK